MEFERAREKEEEELKFMTAQGKEEEISRREKAERKKRKGMEMIQRMMHGTMAKVFIAWREYAMKQKRDRVTLKRFVAKMNLRAAAKCFPVWLELVAERKFLRRFLTRMFLGKNAKVLLAGWKRWQGYVTEMQRLEHEHGVTSLQDLVDELSTKVAQQDAQIALLMNNLGEAKREKMEAAQRNMKKRMQMWMNACLSSTMEGWKLYVKKEKEDRLKVKRFLSKLVMSTASKCFLAWKNDVSETKKHKAIICRVAAKLQNGVLVRIINAWRSFAGEGKRQRVMLERFAKRLKNSQIIASFASWQEFVELRLKMKYYLQIIFNKLTMGSQFAAMDQWKCVAESAKKAEEEEKNSRYLSLQEQEQRKEKLEVAERKKRKGMEMIQRMMHGTMAKVFIAWREYAMKQKRDRVTLKRFVAKMNLRAAAKCFPVWLELVAERKFLRRFLTRMFLGKNAKVLLAGWKRWQGYVTEMQRLEHEHGVTSLQDLVDELSTKVAQQDAQIALLMNNLGEAKREKMEAAQRNMKKRMQMWMNACLSSTMEGWKLYVKKEKEDRLKVKRFLSKLVMSTASKCFLAWKNDVSETKKHKAIICRVAAKLQNGVLVRIINAWRSFAGEGKRQRVMLERFAKRLKNSQIIASFASWQEFVELRLKMKYYLQIIFNKLTMGSQFAAMDQWKCIVREQQRKEDEERNFAFLSKQEQEAKLYKQREATAKKQRAMEMIQRMVNGCLASTLIAWKQFTKVSKKERVLLIKFARKVMMRVAGKCLMQWIEYMRVRKWSRGLMIRFVAGKGKRLLQQAVRLWSMFVGKMRELEAVEGTEGLHTMLDEMQNKIDELEAQNVLLISQLGENKMRANEIAQRNMNKFIMQWTQKALTNTMRGWKLYAKGCREDRLKMKRFLAKLTMGTMARCFNAWSSMHYENRRNSNIMKKIAARLNNRTLFKIINYWRTLVQEEKRYKVAVGRFIKRINNREIGATFVSWVDFVEQRLRLKYLAGRVFNKLSNSSIFAGWERWNEVIEWQKTKEKEAFEFEFLSKKQQEEERQKKAAAEKKQSAALRTIQKMVHGCLATTLQGWKDFVKAEKHDRLVLARFAKRMQLASVVKTLAKWKDYRTERKWLRSLMHRMIGGKIKQQQRAAIQAWVRYAYHLKELAAEHGTSDLHQLVENLHHKVGELESQNILLMNQLGETQMKKNELAQRSMSRFIQQWQNKCLVTTLMAWKQFSVNSKEDKVKMARFIKRMTQGWIVRCFDAWRDDHNESKKNKLIIYRVGQRMRNGLLVRIVNCWRQMVADVKRERYIIDRISRRMLNRTVNGAMASWVEYVCLRKRLKYLALKIFNRLSNSKVFGAFLKWAEFNEGIHAQTRGRKASRQ